MLRNLRNLLFKEPADNTSSSIWDKPPERPTSVSVVSETQPQQHVRKSKKVTFADQQKPSPKEHPKPKPKKTQHHHCHYELSDIFDIDDAALSRPEPQKPNIDKRLIRYDDSVTTEEQHWVESTTKLIYKVTKIHDTLHGYEIWYNQYSKEKEVLKKVKWEMGAKEYEQQLIQPVIIETLFMDQLGEPLDKPFVQIFYMDEMTLSD